MKPRIPDFAERSRLEELVLKARAEGIKLRRIRRSCGHTEGHLIKDGSNAPDEYKRLHRTRCGACGGSDLDIEDDE